MRYWLIFIPFIVLIILLGTIIIDLFYFKNIDNKYTIMINVALIFHIVILFIISYLSIVYLYFTVFIS